MSARTGSPKARARATRKAKWAARMQEKEARAPKVKAKARASTESTALRISLGIGIPNSETIGEALLMHGGLLTRPAAQPVESGKQTVQFGLLRVVV